MNTILKPTDPSAKARDRVRDRLHRGLIGPGSDIFALPDAEEIIGDYPLSRYASAVLFPPQGAAKTQAQADEAHAENATPTESETDDAPPEDLSETDEGSNDAGHAAEPEQPQASHNADPAEPESTNHFFPRNIALTFCVEAETTAVNADFSFGLYHVPHQQVVRMPCPEAVFSIFKDEKNSFPFRHLLNWENGQMWLENPLKGKQRRPRTEDFARLDEYEQSDLFKKSELREVFHLFKKLIGRAWQREAKRFSKQIELPQPGKESNEALLELGKEANAVRVEFFVKTWLFHGKKFVKIGLLNASPPQPRNRFTNQTPELNRRCLFQPVVKIQSDSLLPYHSPEDLNPFDAEAEELNLLFSEVRAYGIGHNCAVEWDEKTGCVQTTFLPEHDVLDVKNRFLRKEKEFLEADYDLLEQSHNLHNLSIFSPLPHQQTIENLRRFVGLYAKWIENQRVQLAALNSERQKIGSRIVERQSENLRRLRENLDLLASDERVFRAFQWANTALLLQIIVSNDKNFEEKDLADLATASPENLYNSLEFFKNLPAEGISYRPFQLAFLLLSLEGIARPDSASRRETVDLIWFPTGGGKTEAYLAVAAFAMIFRRLQHPTRAGGVAVMMRYTLRLLTAQQFERASKLVAALEFLREKFSKELGNESFRIGLWVGNQLTPGKLDDAQTALEKIEKECSEQGGSPTSKNIFQIDACPWCGTKLISQDLKGRWQSGFEVENKRQKRFFIRCLNSKCAFHREIPVQIVDEMLYREPPTLLFATVDKFAQLAWREETHRFFNSLAADGSLPPDLIIQDELHLLSGPLGSIVGLFESVVEMLATRRLPDGSACPPKIIASTATTRNTHQQIGQIYGNRAVNIFPPAGLGHEDSFFARVAATSRRRYLGFMPVGKTAVEAQLRVLAQLLVGRLEASGDPAAPLDPWWTVVSYYNSLRDLGRMNNKVGDEIKSFAEALQNRLFRDKRKQLSFNTAGLVYRTEELTSRIESAKVKATLRKLENKFGLTQNSEYFNVKPGTVDLVLTTNMFSVGIDIGRLNLMLMNGMPRNIAEYIQATSRVGRSDKGLVVAFLDANRARDKSYFEQFVPFHSAFYRNIEPLSVTPFTENTLEKTLTTVLVAYVRNAVPGMAPNASAALFQKERIEPLVNFFEKRFAADNPEEWLFFEKKIRHLAADWEARIQNSREKLTFKQLLKRPGEVQRRADSDWVVMNSLREVDTDTFIELRLKEPFSTKNSNPT